MAKSRKFSATSTTLADITSYEAGITQASAFRVTKKVTDASLKIYGITSSQWFMIGAIHDSGEEGISVTDLSQILGTNLPFVTNSTNVLVERGIVVRATHGANGRMRVLTINPDFTPMINKIETSVRAALRETIYSGVTQQELLTYIKVLYKFTAISDKE